MGRITTSVGLSTGFPIVDTVDKLIAVEGRQRDQLTAQSQKLTNQKNAYTQLTALAVGLQLTAVRLASASLYNQRTAATSNDTLITAKVNDGASPAIGQYSFVPVQTAQSQQLQSTRFASKTTAVGAGNFSIGFGGFLDHGVSLDELREGQGFSRGKIRITDRSGATADIDLTYARTIDDVLQAINTNSTVNVRAEASGNRLRLIDETGATTANLRVQEVGNTSTAASLGLSGINVAASSANGAEILKLFSDLSLDRLNDGVGVQFDDVLPDLKLTFRDGTDATLDLHKLEIKGTKAKATTPGTNSTNAKAVFTAVKGGSAFDNVVIRFVDNTSIVKGSEAVAYDDSNPSLKTLTFQIRAGQTTAKDIVNALNNDATASKIFTAALPSGSSGAGLVSVEDSVATSGGAVTEPVPGGSENTIGDILTALNNLAPTKLHAQISSDGQRIELTDLTSDTGGTFSVVDLNNSKVARDLGLTATASSGVISGKRVIGGLKTSLLSSLNGGAGLGTLGTLDITDRSGATASIDLSAAETVDDIVSAINAAGLGVEASINSARNGIQIVDTTGSTASNLIIANGDGTNTADKLGVAIDEAATTKSSGTLKLKTVGENTLLSSFYGGAGVSQGAFTITDTLGAKATVNINDSVKTVGDAIHAINSLGLAIQAKINEAGDGITIVDTAHGGGTLTVAELGGTTAKGLRLTNAVQTVSISGQPTQVIDGSTTINVDISATDTLEDIAKKVNDLGVGVRASILNDGSSVRPFRLSLFNERTGTASTLSIDTSAASFSFDEVVRARDALLAVGDVGGGSGYLASSATNTFTDAVPDVTLTIKGTSTAPVTVSVDSTSENLSKGVQAFVDSYNKLQSKIQELTAYDTDKNQAAVLQGDSTVLRLQSDISRLFSGRLLNAGPIQALQSVGIVFKQDGTLSFDASQLQNKFSSNPDDVKSFFSRSTYGVSARVKTLGDQLAGVGNSLLIGRTVTLDAKLTSLQDRIDFWTAKLDRDRENLLNKFYASEAAISKIKNNTSFLSTLSTVADNFRNSG